MDSKNLSMKQKFSFAFGPLPVIGWMISGISLKQHNDANNRFTGMFHKCRF